MTKAVLIALLATLAGVTGGYAATSGRIVVTDEHKTVDVRFGEQERAVISDYYREKKPKKEKKLPPGLAKREQLPPGLARRDTLPPGLQGRHLPSELETRLPALPAPYVRVVVGADIVLMDKHTRVVFDILRGAAD